MESRLSMIMLFLASRRTYSLLSLSPVRNEAPYSTHVRCGIIRESINANHVMHEQEQALITKDEGASTFWYTVSRKKQDARSSTSRWFESLPDVPALDQDGPLPQGAYVTLGDTSCDPKPTCRVSVALSSPSTITDSDVKEIHRLIDSGFTSFQLPNATFPSTPRLSQLYRQVQKRTPRSVMHRVQMTVPIPVSRIVSQKSARTLIMDMLSECRAEALDNVQLVFDAQDDPRRRALHRHAKYRESRPPILSEGEAYFLDALDALRELQRDGRVRSVSARDLHKDAASLAERSGFSSLITSNSVDGSILHRPCVDPWGARALHSSTHDEPSLPASAQPVARIPLLFTSPLAGGFLTGRYLMNHRLPHPWDMTEHEQRVWSSQLFYHWYRRLRPSREPRLLRSNPETSLPVILWNEYQSLLASLQEVVHGYPGSDIASVALRWLLQQDPEDEPSRAATMKTGGSSLPAVAGVVVTSQLHHHREKDDYTASRSTLSRRAQALRKVFTFSLSQAEMELINDLSGWWGFDADAGGELA